MAFDEGAMKLPSWLLNGFDAPPPSSYYWFLPKLKSASELDALSAQGLFPSLGGMLLCLPYFVAFGLARMVLTRLAFKPLALYAMNLQLQEKEALDPDLSWIDVYVSRNGFITTAAPVKRGEGKGKGKRKLKPMKKLVDEMLSRGEGLGAKGKLTEERLRKYLKADRNNKNVEMKVIKFVEALWRGIFYTIFVVLGAYTLFFDPTPVDWVQDPMKMWLNWPQPVKPVVYLYYHLALGCYLHQLMWTEVSRSDALEMILHHLTTILLLVMSFLTQFTRVGTSILFVHDVADVFLESAKCFNYTHQNNLKAKRWAQPLCDVLFALFALSFFVTRLIIFPYHLAFSLYQYSPLHVNGGATWPGYFGFVSLLGTLQVLHVFWFSLIAKMVWRMCTSGIEKDERSEDEAEEDEDEDVGASGGRKGRQ